MKNKIIVIEGTDCSGKETQTKLLMEKLQNDGLKVNRFGFPQYDTPTGKIVGGPLLGKEYICNCWFPEHYPNIEAKVASLYFAADRRYNLPKIKEYLAKGHLILDRYVDSNAAHQGGKIHNKKERLAMYEWLENLEYGLLELPRPDIKIFLYVPYENSFELRESRAGKEKLDEAESSKSHLIDSEKAYLELAKLKDYVIINCIKDNKIRTIEDINQEIYKSVIERL